MAFLDDLKKKAAQTVQDYAKSAEGQKRLSEYNASNAKKSTVSSVKNTVQKTFKPITDLASKATPKMESNWYKGSKPTQRETLARIYEVGNQDPSKRESLMQMYQAELSDPTSPIYNPYTSATTTSLSKTNLSNTLKAQQEWEELTKELAWWAQHPSRNYSDDEIVARVNWKNYPTLAKMDDGRENGSPYALTEAVGYSKDAMYGVLWAARNPNKSTGDYMLDAVQSVLGRGKQYQPDEKTANRLNPKSKEYNPYAVGSTMDELAYKYGVYSFDQEWLDNNRHLIANPDTNADYGKIYNAVKNTEAINAEAKSFNNDVARLLEAGQPVDVDKIIERGEYSHLKKIRESLDSGQRIDTTAAIDFDPYLLQTDADAYLQQVAGDYTTDQYDQMLSDNMGGSYLPDESKQNSEELRKLNTDVNLPEYIPVATEHELRAFKTTANAGYSDVVYTTADLIADGTGGLAQANAAQQKAAHAYANKNLFAAWDALNDEVGFADAMPDDVAAFLQKYFPEKYEAGELPTMYDVATLDMSNHPGEDLNNVVATWNEMYEYAEVAMEDAAGRNEAAEKARQTVADVMDDLAEVYGEGTDQYNAAVATYEMAYAYTRGVPKVWRAYDAYQDASAEGPITVEYGNSVLTNQRGSNARDIRVLNALIENAEIMGLPEQYVKNMRQQVEALKTQNDLLNAHKLQENEDYDQQVAAFDAQYQPYKPAWFSKPSHAEVVMHAVYDPESAIALGAAEQSDTVMLAMSMTPEERDNYKYKFMTEGEESATAYFDALSENLYVRSAEERSERTQAWASANEWNSALATVGSVAMTPLEGFSALATVVSELQGNDINPYGPTFLFSQAKSDLRTGTKKGFEKAYGDNKVITAIYNTFYDALTSAADSGISTLMGGKYGSMILGLSGFNSAVMDASMRGASDERAIIYGMVTAGVEAFTEHSQIDKMLGAFNAGATGVRGFVGELLNSMASEAGEEALSSILGTISDDVIMQSMSNREAAIEQYIATGLTREEAEAQASKDIMTDILYSGLVGGISGGATTSIGYAAGKVLGDNEQPAQTEQPTGTPVQRAEAALSTAMQDGVGEVQQTATVAGVLQSFGLSGMEANAAAKNIVGSTNTRVLRKMLAQADDPAGLIQAIAMGSVSERSRSWAILHNARVDSKNAKDIGDQLIAAYNEDVNDQSVMTEYDARVAFDAEADATADIIANSGRVDTSALDKAKEQSTNAQLEMDKAEAEVEAAQQAVVEAQDRFNANPSDDKAKLALKNAINLQYKARERSEAAKRNAILAKKHLDKANADFKAQTEANMVAAREQAKTEVQQKQAELEAQKQEAAVAAEDLAQSSTPKIGVSQFAAKTGQNTSVLSNDVKDQLRKSPFYQKTSERQNMDIAINNIEIEGYETRRNKLLDGSINLFTPEGQVEAFVLAKAAKEAGDAQGESAIAFKVKESGTLLGQSLAMRRMYLEMTPEGKTQFLQRTVDKINQDYANRGKATRVVLPEWVEARLEEADGDEEAIAKVVDRAYADIAEQMPPDWKSRLNAWRYTAMLANPRTHIRNIAGNLMFMPAVSIKNKIGAVAEMVFASPDERTKTFAPVRQEYKDFAVAQLEDVKDALTGGGKHNPMSEIQSRRRDFNTKALEWLSKGNGKLLEKEDAFFLNKHFVNALSGFLQARNVDVNNVDANTLQAGLDYAVLEAQKATYRDASEIADKLSKFTSGLSNSKKRSARAAGLLVEGALPFKKTPINVMRRGIEYSPIGLLNTLTVGMRDMQQGTIEKSEFLDRLASGLTGTGLAAVGCLLYNLGNLKLSLDEPEDELEKLGGAQEYSIELFGKSFTIDWLSPSAMPLFVGGAIAELFEKDGEGFNLNTVTDALMNIAEPVFNLSMLDGVNSLLSAASNSENGVADIVIRAAESYATQFVPTVLGAFARTLDPVRRTTYTDKNSSVPSSLQYISDSVVNKIPGTSYAGQPYLNAWGEEDTTESIFMRAVENFLSPGYMNDLTTDDVEKGLMELYDETKEPGLVPKLPQKYFTVNKQRKDLTGEEYERLVKERGQTAKSLHEQLFGNPDFLNLPAKYQVYALEQVWEYATQTAKSNVAPQYEVDSWIAAAGDAAYEAILERTNDKLKKDRSTEMKNNLYSAIDSGDIDTAITYAEGIIQGGTEKSSLRSSITNRYKVKYQAMYKDGDVEGMRDLENMLLTMNVGYKLSTIQKWIVENEE